LELDGRKGAAAFDEIMKGKSLIFVSLLGMVSCHRETQAPEAEAKSARSGSTTAAAASPGSPEEDAAPSGPSKASDRTSVNPKKAPVAAHIPGTNQVKSPSTGEAIDVTGVKPGTVMQDPVTGKEFTVPEDAQEFEASQTPDVPVGVAVGGKPGMVFSPFNGKIVDVTDIPEGKLVADPTFPASEKKYFRVPPAAAASPEGQGKQ
jgi:hypothetical protein